jgi:hypothetical protein
MSPPPTTQWTLPGYRVVWFHDKAARDGTTRVAPAAVRMLLRQWLSSRKRLLREVADALDNSQSRLGLGTQPTRRDEQLLQHLNEAFQSGKLLLLETQPPVAQPQAGKGGPPSQKAVVPGVAARTVQREKEVHQLGIVAWDRAPQLRLRSSPNTEGDGNILGNLAFNTLIQVMKLLPGDWLYVSTRDGRVGYVAAQHVWFGPVHSLPEPEARVHRVAAGTPGTAIAIAEQYYGGATRWGRDLRFYVNVLAAVNRLSIPSSANGWKSVRFQADQFIWVPSLEFANAMRGRVSSGSYSHDATQALIRVLERVAQLQNDLRDAVRLSLQYLPAAIKQHVEEAIVSILTSLLMMAVGAVLLLAITTAIGAAVGALAGGVGAAPGAAIGFEVGLALLDWLGLAFLVKWVVDCATRIGSAFAIFLGSVWNARGDRKKVDQAARELAEAIGVTIGVILEALVIWATAKGAQAAIGALKGTAFAKAFGENRLGSWLRERIARHKEGQSPLPGARETLARAQAPKLARELGITEAEATALLRVADAPTLKTLKAEVGESGLKQLANAPRAFRDGFFQQLRAAGNNAAARAKVLETLRPKDAAPRVFFERVKSRIAAQPDKFKLTYTEAELQAIVKKGKELGLSDHVIECMIYVGSRTAKALTAVELMQQMHNWAQVVSKRGYPYRFTNLPDYQQFSKALLEGLRKAELPADDVRIQGSSLRKPSANDVDIAVFVDQPTFDHLLIERFHGRIALKSGEKLQLKGKSHTELLQLAKKIEAHPDNYNAQARTFWNAMESSIISSKSDIVRPLKDLAADISGKYPHLNIESVSILLKKGLFDLPPDLPVKE